MLVHLYSTCRLPPQTNMSSGGLSIASLSVILLMVASGIAAQSTTATCLPSFQWASNSQHQSPCLVAAYLMGDCNGGSYSVVALPEGSHYLGPAFGASDICQCSTVSYSAISACGLCQNRTITSWSTWATNCATVSISTYPKPLPVDVPAWAFLDVKTSDTFNVAQAKQDANRTESTSGATQPTSSSSAPTVSTTTTTTSSSSSVSPSPSSSSSGATSSSTLRADAIGGGVVGGVLGLALIIGISYWLIRRRRHRIARDGTVLASPAMSQLPAESLKYVTSNSVQPSHNTLNEESSDPIYSTTKSESFGQSNV